MRKTIVQTVVKSKREIPHFYVQIEVDLSCIEKIRSHWNLDFGPQPSVNHFILKAAALALIEVPEIRATFTPQGIIIPAGVDLGFAVAVEGGMLIPVIRRADRLSLLELAAEARDLVRKTKEKKLFPYECEGGSFTVSNLGMLGVKSFAAIIPPGQGGILAVGAAELLPRWDGAQWQPRPFLTLTLSVDHRVVDGDRAAQFLQAVRAFLEQDVSEAVF